MLLLILITVNENITGKDMGQTRICDFRIFISALILASFSGVDLSWSKGVGVVKSSHQTVSGASNN